ncbi:PREDICTED: uncharacterized protein LOC109583029 [Amphimedon queenslandica]|uniref:RUN domain-containing protein n=1 Tax=Amphimedon queenslandica TaxID=400682 RepID=A0A1X7UKP8_AMPQE|nr:PREDICTED: uncharacterized protein LOC109583029 [Amphimedon queenslandica]|eukprot:XP_019853761.1 PREDICTED: uncharacterized protein LOC109583029 [Amphimedon queenslandica]
MAAVESSSSEVIVKISSISHPLLEEMKGILSRLKMVGGMIQDGCPHLVPFCETIESVFRHGLKQPNSFFGLNRQDYWSWIEMLQEYYFNEKQNPLLHSLVTDISSTNRIRTLQGRGRCFIRGSLTNKLISVPVEHLVKNTKLTEYWYVKDSIIASTELRAVFMELLFQATEVDFDLDYKTSGFLNETWVIPVYVTYKLPPVKTLDIGVRRIDERQLVVDIEKDCLAYKAGIEVWDIVEELCGQPIHLITGNFQKYVAKHSIDFTEITVVKKHLPDGSPFAPVLRRQLLFTHKVTTPTSSMWIPEFINPHTSAIIRTIGEKTEYSLVYLGKHIMLINEEEVGQKTIDTAVSRVLHDTRKPEDITLTLSTVGLLLLLKERKLLVCDYRELIISGQSTAHMSCLAIVCKRGVASKEAESKELVCYVCETPTFELAQCVCMHIAQGFSQISILQ